LTIPVFGALCLLVLGAAPAAAQSLRGTVTDSSTTHPLEGAVVMVVGTSKRVLTPANGEYSITGIAPGTYTVRATMIGRAPVEHKVALAAGDETTLNFSMILKPIELDELVSIGYGTVTRDNLTTSVSSVSSEDITATPNASSDAALAGRAAGVQVIQNAGNPGNAITVRVRGPASITASSQPLYVVDGVPMISEDISQLGLGGQGIRAITGLSSEDIATIDVLKDAASASIYGSRGSNGVVLITTKRGKAGESTISFDSYYGTQSAAKKIHLLNGPQYLEYMREGATNDGYDPNDFFPTTGANTDWQGAVFRSAPIASSELSASGGNDKIKYRASGTLFDQRGIVITSGYRRLGGRINLDFQASKRLSVSAGLALSGEKNNRIEADDNLEGIVGNAIAHEPYFPIRQPDGHFTTIADGMAYVNALDLAAHNTTLASTNTVLANLEARYDLGGGLQITGRGGIDFYNLTETQYQSPLVPGSDGAKYGGVAKRGYSNGQRYVLDGFLNYDKTFSERHVVGLTLGTSVEQSITDNSFLRGEALTDEKLHQVSNATTVTQFSGTFGENGLVSYFGRGNYTLDDKYLIGVSFRSDGASVFGPNKRYGFFPGGSFAWVASREKFLANSKTVSLLKFRTSLGRTGNQALSDYPYQALYCTTNYGTEPGYNPCTLGNPNLRWEKTTQLDLGADLELWNGRVAFNVDWYRKNTSDLLLSRPTAPSTGYTTFTDNIGAMSNKGLELQLTVVPIQPAKADGFRLVTSMNVATNRNRVTKLYGNQPFNLGYYDINRVEVGQRLGAFYAYHFLGVDPATGDAIYQDIDGDGSITTSDKKIVGNPWPDFTGGFTGTASWKHFDLTAFFQFSKGNDVFNGMRVFSDEGGYNYDNKFINVLDRWQQPGDITRSPRASFDGTSGARLISDRFIEDGSYLRLADLTIGYELPERFSSSLGMRNTRVYIRGQNVFTSTKYAGYNPEVNSNGSNVSAELATDFYAYPVARTWSFGVQAGW
jgi:TonB-linked SusC/RagA family outer membrane protein